MYLRLGGVGMKYTSADDMRRDLAKVVDDPELVEATIERYFTPKDLPKAAPVNGYQPTEQEQDKTFQTKMSESSAKLGDAIDHFLAGRPVQTSAKLNWRQHSQVFLRDPDSNTWATQDKAVAEQQARRERVQARIVNSPSPCFRCGAARGCSPTKCAEVEVMG